jgi:hypothetical protein
VILREKVTTIDFYYCLVSKRGGYSAKQHFQNLRLEGMFIFVLKVSYTTYGSSAVILGAMTVVGMLLEARILLAIFDHER